MDFGRSWRVMLLALVLPLVVLSIAWAATGISAGVHDWVTVGHVDDLRSELPIFDEEHEVYVIRIGGGLLALYARGPWQDEPVRFCETSTLFETAGSGSKFDRYGRYFGGPAPRGMTRLPVRVLDDGRIQVKWHERIAGPRRARRQALQPLGPLCIAV